MLLSLILISIIDRGYGIGGNYWNYMDFDPGDTVKKHSKHRQNPYYHGNLLSTVLIIFEAPLSGWCCHSYFNSKSELPYS